MAITTYSWPPVSTTVTGVALETTQQQVLTQVTAINANTDTLEASFTTLNAKDFATQTTLAALNTKVPSNLTVTSTRLLVDGSGVTQPVSGTVTANAGTGTFAVSAASLPLPTGAATAALQTQPGVDIGDVTINNTNGAGAVNIQDGGNSITVDGTVAATQSGTWDINNVSGTVSLPTGAATAAKQPALGTAGSASADVITVQGIASMTALKVDGSAVTQPVSLASQPANSGRTKVAILRNDYSSTSVTTSAYVQLTASTSATINKLQIFDSSGSALYLAVGASSSEVDQIAIFPGGNGDVDITITSGSRISVKAIDTTASVGQLIINCLS